MDKPLFRVLQQLLVASYVLPPFKYNIFYAVWI